MWIALNLRTRAEMNISVMGMPKENHGISFINIDTGELGVLSVYETKAQAIKDNPKGTIFIQAKESKDAKN